MVCRFNRGLDEKEGRGILRGVDTLMHTMFNLASTITLVL